MKFLLTSYKRCATSTSQTGEFSQTREFSQTGRFFVYLTGKFRHQPYGKFAKRLVHMEILRNLLFIWIFWEKHTNPLSIPTFAKFGHLYPNNYKDFSSIVKGAEIMTEIQNNRAFTTDRRDLKNRNFCDTLYLVLLSLSSWDGENRYVLKKNFTKTQLAKICGVSLNTMTKRFKELLEEEKDKVPFLVEEKDRYIFTDRAAFILVPAETIEWLLIYNQIPEDTFKIYAYLANKYFFINKSQSFGFTITELLDVTGYSKDAHNNAKIVAKLELLSGIGMLDYEFATKPKVNEDGKYGYTHILKSASKTPNKKQPNDTAFNELYQEILARSKKDGTKAGA